MYRVSYTPEYAEWYAQLEERAKDRIEGRMMRIRAYGHFGDCKSIAGGTIKIRELRWKNGTRVYFTLLEEESVLLLLGGYKNGQKKDIRKAQTIAKAYVKPIS